MNPIVSYAEEPLSLNIRSACSELQADDVALQAGAGDLEIFFRAGKRAQGLFGMFACEACASGINLFRALGDFGEHGDAVCVDFDETAGDMQAMRCATLQVREDASLQLRDERRVAWQDAKLAVRARHVDGINRLRKHAALWC